MRVTWYGHACFRLEADGVSVVTDPYEPEASGFRAVDEPATIVVRSSPDDRFHCNAAMIPGDPALVEAVDLARSGPQVVRGVPFEAFATQESLVHKTAPLDNAMYRFTLGGVRVLHLGDLGNPIDPAYLDRLTGEVDLLLALAGGPPTIELPDLDAAIAAIRPRVVIPMHFKVPQLKLKALPVDDLLARHPDAEIRHLTTGGVDLDPTTLPPGPAFYILTPTR